MTPVDLKKRTKEIALRVVRVTQSLDDNSISRTMGHQLLRLGTSVGANYRAASRARSPAEFRSKMGIVLEEADETAYWMELLIDSQIVKADKLQLLLQEANELVAISVASVNTSRRNSK
jgi:four helix bundle protein